MVLLKYFLNINPPDPALGGTICTNPIKLLLFINDSSKILFKFAVRCKPCYRSSVLNLSKEQLGRKVRTAQSNAPVNSRVPTCREQIVPQKITAFSLS